MSINETEYRIALQAFVRGLKVMAGEGDMASVQINSDGDCILRIGCQCMEHLSVDGFARVLYEEVISRLESDDLEPQ